MPDMSDARCWAVFLSNLVEIIGSFSTTESVQMLLRISAGSASNGLLCRIDACVLVDVEVAAFRRMPRQSQYAGALV